MHLWTYFATCNILKQKNYIEGVRRLSVLLCLWCQNYSLVYLFSGAKKIFWCKDSLVPKRFPGANNMSFMICLYVSYREWQKTSINIKWEYLRPLWKRYHLKKKWDLSGFSSKVFCLFVVSVSPLEAAQTTLPTKRVHPLAQGELQRGERGWGSGREGRWRARRLDGLCTILLPRGFCFDAVICIL